MKRALLIIPNYNERENVHRLLAEIEIALGEIHWEALFVDDSTDGTDLILDDLASSDPRVRLLHRTQNRGGLAGAVVEGLGLARGQYLCVLDADLQHPPARIPTMLGLARAAAADVVSMFIGYQLRSGAARPARAPG